jgi:hypothetical protein
LIYWCKGFGQSYRRYLFSDKLLLRKSGLRKEVPVVMIVPLVPKTSYTVQVTENDKHSSSIEREICSGD